MKILLSKSSRIILPVSTLGLFVLTLIWFSYFRQTSFDRKDAIRFAIEKNSNLAVALEQYAISTLHNADAVLQLARIEYAHEGARLNLQKVLSEARLKCNIIGSVSIMDSRGRLIVADSSFPAGTSKDFSARSYFIFHATHTIDSLLISKPMLSGSMGKPVIVISRRFNDADGKFAGVVALEIEPSRFTSFYAQARLLPNDIISLIAPDGITSARRTGTMESSGEDIHQSPLFTHVAQDADSFYFAQDAIRHIPSWFSYRKLKDYPIIATVGSSEHEILAGYSDQQVRFLAPRIITSVLIILFSVLITLILLHRRRESDRAMDEKERYERLLTEQMIAVQEREREWIGREMHDNVSQVLTTVKLYLETASRQEDNPLISRSMQLINSSISEIRNLSHQLTAPTLGTRSLIDSINALIEMVGFSTPLLFEFDHRKFCVPLVMSQKIALYRILQEQLNNIIKHAEATRILIVLTQKADNIILTIRDNGKGFDSKVKSTGMGLNSITSRAKVFGGTVHLDTAPQKGCRLTVTVPILASMEEQAV
jgi:signal transduction histidine kinase